MVVPAALLWGACVSHLRATVLEAPDVQLAGPRVRVEGPAATDPGAVLAAAGLSRALGGGCAEGCDAVVAVGALRYEEEVSTAPLGAEWEAVRVARVVTDFRLADDGGDEIEALHDVGVLDRWIARGETEALAAAALPPAERCAQELADGVGVAYAHRLMGGAWSYARPYYGGGALRLGAAALRAGEAQDALAQWNLVLQGAPPPGVAARAHHDLAVAYEWIGASVLAREHADLAVALGAPPRSRRYADLLAHSPDVPRVLRQF